MKPEIKQKWIDALLFGSYQQGQYYLKTVSDQTRFCCLGVLCDVVKPDAWQGVDYLTQDNEERWTYQGHTSTDVLPTPLMEDLEITEREHDDLVRMNDDENKSFEEIATYIKENL